MKHAYRWLRYTGLTVLLAIIAQTQILAQARVQVRVVSMEVLNNNDCDGFLSGDSDFVFEFVADDNTLGNSNNNPVLFGVLGSFNYGYQNGNNGPWTLTSPNGNINPNSGVFFDHEYVCPSDVPTQINIEWRGYENDAPTNYSLTGTTLDEDLQTGNQNGSIPVPAAPGVVTQTFNAAGSGGSSCGTQNYRITFEVTRIAVSVNYWPDAICSAVPIPMNGSVTRAYCPPTLEPNEPRQGDIANNGSVWFYFTAPASGRVDISTDNGGTDFGTEIHVYHAADGIGCTAGTNVVTGVQIKDKFEYLSSVDRADLGGFANVFGEADITFDDCAGIFSSNPLVAGEVYYVQMSADNGGDRGYIEVSVSDMGGSPAEAHDIPCQAVDVTATAQSTTVRTESGGQPESALLDFGCSTGRETGNPHTSSNPDQYQAYDYDHPATNNGTIHESVWTSFTAPNSGRVYFEGNVEGIFSANEFENTALFGFDPRFAPGTPADYSCANLSSINAAEGGSLISGPSQTAIILQECLEPGYEYYAMVDPSGAATGSDAFFWLYDPSASDPLNNPPENDILCLAMANSLYEIPVQEVNQPPLPFQAVAGNNERACIETLAGEPFSTANPATRADQTVWHTFTVPPSGVVEIKLRAYIGLNQLNYAVYPLLNGTSCYGGLAPATFTNDGTQATQQITAIASGNTDFNGDVISLCCLTPGARYALQLDGGSPGDVGQYIIEYIDEIEVYAGDSQYETEMGDSITYNGMDTAFICFGDTIFPSVALDPLGNTTTEIPLCLDLGYVLHDVMPIPSPIAGSGFTYIDSVRFGNQVFVNNTNGSGTFGNPFFNQVYYVSAAVDEDPTWGQFTCPSSSIENGAPVVFLQPINVVDSYNSNNCTISFTATGGEPAYNGSQFSWIGITAGGDTISGTADNGVPVVINIQVADIYTFTITDGSGCGQTFVVNATPCLDPCINNPVTINPSPIDSTVYTCLPGGDSALVTIVLGGGYPSLNASQYNVTVNGSTAAGANGSYTSGVGNFSFTVLDGDSWSVFVSDTALCADTASATFTYNLVNCPDFCTLNPIVASSSYSCFANGSSLVEITMGGGLPAIDGSNYSVSVNGSTVFGQNYNNAQVPGTIGGTSFISLLVNDGDTWQAIITDNNGCADTLGGTYTFNATNCPNLCQLLPVAISPNPADSTVYSCNANGSASVTLFFSGGAPALSGGTYTVDVTGSTVAGQSGTFTSGIGNYTFDVNDGDNWQVILTDANNCADTVSALYQFNPTNCDICTLLPMSVTNAQYNCNGNGTATVDVTLTGGQPGYDGSNYLVTISGSTAGGNIVNDPIAGAIGGSVTYSFPVGDGDNWQVDVTDNSNCTASLSGTFNFNNINCPDICDSIPITVNNPTILCNTNGTADITIDIAGGKPGYDGSNYFVTVTGLTTGGNVLNDPVAGTVGGVTTYTFTVGDGDNWQVFVEDSENCQGSLSGTFVWNATTCGNICGQAGYTNVNIVDTISYDCDGNGNAMLMLEVNGGLPALGGPGNGNYTAQVTINGGTTTQIVPAVNGMGTLILNLNDGDSWEVVLNDDLNCSTDSLAAVFNSVNAVASTNAAFEVLIGDPIELNGSSSTGNITTYIWTPPATINDPFQSITTAFPLETTMFTLEVRDSNDCSDLDSVQVRVAGCVPDHAGFTPNNDGTNDLWQIPCLDLLEGDLEVYNRWGQLVYRKDNYDNTWDGTHFRTGQDCPDATYYYVLRVNYPNFAEPVLFKGTVTIIR